MKLIFKNFTWNCRVFIVSDNYEKKEESQLWNKSSKISSFTTLNEDNDDLKKRWKNENTLNTTDKSTLFLHIGAYENSNETAGSDLFDDENIVRLRKGKFGSVKKRSFSDSLKCRNPFEFLRQQNGDQRNKPEVMQFKASQQLICPNRPSDISAGKNMTKSMVDREMVVKMIQSILAQNTIDPDATQRLYECTMVLAEKVLDYAIEAAKLRNSDKIEKCDIEMAITLIKQA